MKPLEISNRDARCLWLHVNALSENPIGKLTQEGLYEIICRLGFVQLDSIQIVSRAHHHILWSRNQHYRAVMLDDLMENRLVFEHFTHDASILPMQFYPYWRRQFTRMKEHLEERGGWAKSLPSKSDINTILERIENEGPLCSKDFKSNKPDKSVHAWMRPKHKLALDYLWYAGILSTHMRKNFAKYYDLSERIIPIKYRDAEYSEANQIDWLCRQAMQRLGFATEGALQRFWGATNRIETSQWLKDNEKNLVPILVKTKNDDAISMFASENIEDVLEGLKSPTSRLRIINPFDPAIRDRDRLERLFGYAYKIEIFTPAKKRQYGYYVYPILEGDRFIGRIEVKADRRNNCLNVHNVWPEQGFKFEGARVERLWSELSRMARFVGVDDVVMDVAI